MATGSLTLDQVAAHTTVLTVACSRCDRAGQYGLATLITRHGSVGFTRADAGGNLPSAFRSWTQTGKIDATAPASGLWAFGGRSS
jgi:hypothetical protein